MVGPLLGLDAHFGLDGKTHESLETVHGCQTHLLGSRCFPGLHEESLEDGDGRFFERCDAYQQHPFLLAPTHGQHPVTRDLGDGFGPVEVVLEFGAFGLLAHHDLRTDLGGFPIQFPEA